MTTSHPPRTAFVNGRILSMDPAHPEPEVVIIAAGEIAALGPRTLLDVDPVDHVEDLGGCWLVPGLIDAHNHLSIAALHPLWADVAKVRDTDELRRALQAQATRDAEAEWVRAVGWDETESGLLLDRHSLDEAVPDRPAVVVHYTLHQCVVNSCGLDRLGIGRTTADPIGGMIARDLDGNPSGLLIERAWSAAHAQSMASYTDPDRWAECIAARGRVLWREGITAVHDAACAPSAEAAYGRLAARGELPISVLMMPHAEAILTEPPASRLDGPRTGDGDSWLRVGPVKLFADGGIAPALDVCVAGHRSSFGIEFPGLETAVKRAVQHGFDVAVHAIGNVALRSALAAFAAAERQFGGSGRRWRVEHACVAAAAELSAMGSMGVFGVVQPGFLHHIGRAVVDVPFEEDIWLPFGAMLEQGVRLAGSSDDPCAFHEPLRGIAHGTSRITGSGAVLRPDQAVSFEDWLRAYTLGAAMAGGQERERGSITPGKRADLVVLEAVEPRRGEAVVKQTWVDGRCVYSRA